MIEGAMTLAIHVRFDPSPSSSTPDEHTSRCFGDGGKLEAKFGGLFAQPLLGTKSGLLVTPNEGLFLLVWLPGGKHV
jgi:hypothetical protein